MGGTSSSQAAQRALEEVFVTVLPRMVAHARESSVPARGLMPFGLLMYIAGLRVRPESHEMRPNRRTSSMREAA